MRAIRSLLFVAVVVTCAGFAALQAQPIPVSLSPWTHRWDAAHGVFFLQKNTLLLHDSPPLRSYNDDGTQRGADINLFMDFPDALRAHVDDFAAGPDGTTIIAAELIYAPQLVKSVVLTYDSTGILRTVFHPEPYSAEAITADDEGNIYLLGERTDERESYPPYPLLIKYDSSGNILSRAIDSNVFKGGSDAIQSFGRAEDLASAALALQNGNLYVYAPDENEVLVCAVDGTILRQAKLQDVLLTVARADKVHRVTIADVAFVDGNHVVLYVTEHAKSEDSRVIKVGKIPTAAYVVDLTTKKFRPTLRGALGTNTTVLSVKGNQLLTLTRGQQGLDIQAHSLF